MITLVLAECEVERMPAELHADPRVLSRARRRRRPVDQLLLDQALDHEAMRALPDGARRGRPDIAHFLLLLALDSPLAKRGLLRALLHTRHDELVRFRPDLRLPRNQAKFGQLMEDLLRQGEVPLGAPLMTLEHSRDLRGVLREEARGVRVLLDVGGGRARSAAFAELARAGDVTLVVGGFPRGSFTQVSGADVDHVLSVAEDELSAWSAFVPALAGFEDALL